jgi:hypothetical protein
VQIHAERSIAARDRLDATSARRPAAVQATPASGDFAGWVETVNRRPAAAAQLGLQRMLDRRPAVAAQARLAQTLSRRAIQRSATMPAPAAAPAGEELLTRGAFAPAAILPDKSQCDICADSDSKKKALKEKDPLQLMPAPGRAAPPLHADASDLPPSAIAAQAPAGLQIYQRATAGAVMQLIYLWDRKAEDEAPRWSEETEPPEGYLASGRYDDEEHGEDKLYARLGGADLFYGIAYEEGTQFEDFIGAVQAYASENSLPVETDEQQQAAIRAYTLSGNEPLLDVGTMKALYGGSSGWERYARYLGGSGAVTAQQFKELNSELPWAPSGDPAPFACQVAMIEALGQGGSVRFLLDGLENIQGILEGTAYQQKVTSHELKFAMALLGKTVKVSESKEVTPTDGVNVFFYLNRELVTAEQVKSGI